MRLRDWETRLHKVVESAIKKPFKWGKHDCFTFANECVTAVTGIDVIKQSGFKWKSKKDIDKIIKEHKYVDFEQVAEKELVKHFEEIDPKLAQRGDIVVIDTLQGKGLGVVYGHKIACLAQNGLSCISVSRALRAWRIS